MSITGATFDEAARTYRITPIQNPLRSAAFHGAYLSRLPLNPALIIQLDVWDANGDLVIPYEELPFLVCHLSLETASGDDATHILDASSGEVVSLLYGTLITTPAEMQDRAGANGMYFVFPDVSVRVEGSFRLRVSLSRITGGHPLHTCYTTPFDIVPNYSYIAPPITELTRHFDSQGVVRFGLPQSSWP